MKKKRALLVVAAGFLLVLTISVALLPAILSTGAMRPFVLQQANARLPGQLQVEEWSLSWFGGIEGRGIVYDDRMNAVLVKVPVLKTSAGLLAMITSLGKLGTVELIDPAVVFYLSEKAGTRTPSKVGPSFSGTQTEPVPAGTLTLPAFQGQLVLTGGSVLTVTADRGERVIVKDMNAVLDATGPKNPITYRFAFESGDGSGRASGEGSLAVSPDDPLNFQKLRSDSKLNVKNWELQDALVILASRVGSPSGSGRLNAELTLTGSAASDVQLLSRLSIAELKLYGGPLGSDTPTVKGISIELDAIGSNNRLTIKNLAFRSSLARGSAGGEFERQGQQRLSGSTEVDLAEVFTQFPGTLRLREGTRISSGKMVLAAKVASTGQTTSFEGDANIDRVQGVSNGRRLSWDQPMMLKARGEAGPAGLRLDNLSLRSAFLNGDGHGDMRNMKLKLSADLQTALNELKKFIEMKQWEGSGKANLDFDFKEKSADLNSAALELDVQNLVLNRDRHQILPRQNLRAVLTADMNVADRLSSSKLIGPSLTVQSALATGKFTAAELGWNPADGLPAALDLKLDGNLSLQQLSSLLQNLDKLPPDTQLEGQSQIRTEGSLKSGQLFLNDVNVDTRPFILRQNKKTIKEDRLLLTTKGRIDLKKNSLMLAPVDIRIDAGTIRFPELSVADWTDALKDLRIKATADLDLTRLAAAYGDFMALPEKTEISGNGRFDVDVDFSSPTSQYLRLRGNLTPFKLVSDTLPTLSEKSVRVDADLKRSSDGRQVTIENLKIDSNALSLNANGKLEQVAENKVLEAKGNMGLDMALVSAYLKKSGQTQLEFSGREEKPFRIKLVSTGDRWEDPLKHLDFSGAFHVKTIKAFGLDLTPNDVPVRITSGAADASLNSPANGGQLSLQPIINMQKEPYVLSFSNDLDILKNVQITRGLIDGLLATIHPLFKEAVIPDGLLGLHMKHFDWPLSEGGKNSAAFAGTLQLNGIRLNATPFLSRLLDVMRISEREILMKDQSIDFEARNGRITSAPMTLDVGGNSLTLNGSVGFDNTLDFIARVPVTENLVGKDAYRFLQGTTINLPIRGTVSKPQIDEQALQQATRNLVQQSLQKNVEQGVQNLLQNLLKKRE